MRGPLRPELLEVSREMKHVTAPRLPPRTAFRDFFFLSCKSAGDKFSYLRLSENVYFGCILEGHFLWPPSSGRAVCASFCLQHFKRLSPLWPPLSPARSLAYPRAPAGKCHLALAAFRF